MIVYHKLLNFISYLIFVLNFSLIIKGDVSNYGAKLQWSINAQGFHR